MLGSRSGQALKSNLEGQPKVADVVARSPGQVETVTDAGATPSARFYRVVTLRRP